MNRFLTSLAVGAAFAIAAIVPGLMTSHRVQAQFFQQATYVPAANIGGTNNAITLNVPNVSSLSDILGVPITFIPLSANTNATTVNVTSTGVVNINRVTPTGLFALSGGELQAQLSQIVYDGTVFELTNTASQPPIGSSMDFHGTIPTGYLASDGSCYTRTGQYAPLFSVIGTTYNSNAASACSGSQFAVPYANGTAPYAQDNQGANTASRLTNSGTGNVCNGQTLGNICGSQNHTQTLAELVAHTHSYNAGGATTRAAGGSNTSDTPGALTTGSTGSGNAFSILPPTFVVLRGIKY